MSSSLAKVNRADSRTHRHFAHTVLEDVVLLPDLLDIVQWDLHCALESLAKSVHALLILPSASVLRSSRRGQLGRGNYLT